MIEAETIKFVQIISINTKIRQVCFHICIQSVQWKMAIAPSAFLCRSHFCRIYHFVNLAFFWGLLLLNPSSIIPLPNLQNSSYSAFSFSCPSSPRPPPPRQPWPRPPPQEPPPRPTWSLWRHHQTLITYLCDYSGLVFWIIHNYLDKSMAAPPKYGKVPRRRDDLLSVRVPRYVPDIRHIKTFQSRSRSRQKIRNNDDGCHDTSLIKWFVEWTDT